MADCSRGATSWRTPGRLDCQSAPPLPMRFRNLVTMSFRNRLRLFFLLIVIIPMIAVALVLFQVVTRSEESQTDAQLSEAQRVATNLYRVSAGRANTAGRQIVGDNGLREAIADKNPERIQSRLD